MLEECANIWIKEITKKNTQNYHQAQENKHYKGFKNDLRITGEVSTRLRKDEINMHTNEDLSFLELVIFKLETMHS